MIEYSVFFMDDVAKELYRRGAMISDMDEISQTIVNYPRKSFAVDTGDSSMLHGDYSLSFVRDHTACQVWVMTSDERNRMAADDLRYFSRVNVAFALFKVQRHENESALIRA